MPQRPRPATTLLILAALSLGACGTSADDPATTPEPTEEAPGTGAESGDVEVIRAWAGALSEGDIERAAEFFALPSIATNGPALRLRTREDARLFNAALPCGAEVIDAETEGELTTATFRLTERPGPGICGAGPDGEAETAFVIENGKIVEWRRVGAGTAPPAPGAAV